MYMCTEPSACESSTRSSWAVFYQEGRRLDSSPVIGIESINRYDSSCVCTLCYCRAGYRVLQVFSWEHVEPYGSQRLLENESKYLCQAFRIQPVISNRSVAAVMHRHVDLPWPVSLCW